MHRLGGHVLGFADAKMTRAGDFYQESIKDTFHMLEYYGDVIAMRHFQQGAPAEAARWSSRADHQLRRRLGRAPDPGPDRPVHHPARDGHARRPDLPARRRHADADDALDPATPSRSSTPRSIVVGPPDMASCPSSRPRSTRCNVAYREGGDVATSSARPTSSTWSRSSRPTTRSRASSAARGRASPRPSTGSPASCCATRPSASSIILHSLPRMDELPADVDDTRHQRYWVEAFNGVVAPDGAPRARPRRGRVGDRPCRRTCAAATSSRLQDWTHEEIETILEVAFDLKRRRALGEPHPSCATRSWPCSSSSRAPGRAPRSRRGWPSSAATPSSSRAGRPRSPTATPPRRSARSSAATTTASPSATSTGASATSTSARSPRPAGCPSSTCSATSTTPSRSSPTS